MEIEELANRYSFAGIKNFWIELSENREITILLDLTRQDEELLNCVTSMQVAANWEDNIRDVRCLELFLTPEDFSQMPFSDCNFEFYDCVKFHIKVGEGHNDH